MLNSGQICYTGYFIALRSHVNHGLSQFGIATLSSQDKTPSVIATFETAQQCHVSHPVIQL